MKRSAVGKKVSLVRSFQERAARVAADEERSPGTHYRIKDCGGGLVDATYKAGRANTRFDEVVVGNFLHVERLDNRSFYGSIGGLTLWWTVESNGDVVITHAEMRDAKFLPGAFDWLMPELEKKQNRRGRAGRRE